MNDERLDARFRERLDPPPGGLVELRRRLARRERRRKAVTWSVAYGTAAAGLALVAALIWAAPFAPRAPLVSVDDLLAIRLGVVEAPSEPASVVPGGGTGTALLRVPTRDERVALYLVGSVE